LHISIPSLTLTIILYFLS